MNCPDPIFVQLDLPSVTIALAFRRGVFAQYTTLDQLCRGSEREIKWKPEFLDQPVLCLMRPGGFTLDPEEPLNYSRARDYLARVSIKSGFGGK